jgi:hypothetical protein
MKWKERKPLMMMMRPPERTENSAASARPTTFYTPIYRKLFTGSDFFEMACEE